MNLGLGNVLFKNKDAVERVLNDPSVVIRNKKVKVEPFKCGSSCPKNPSIYAPNSLKVKSVYPHQSWTEPILKSRSKRKSDGTPYGIKTSKSKTALSVVELQSMDESDFDEERPSFRAAICPPQQSGNKRETNKDAKEFLIQDASTKYCEVTGPAKSLEVSLIEEECEESPRPKRGKENYDLSPEALETEEKAQASKFPIISIHGGIGEVAPSNKIEKGSFHSVKPTCKTYYKNPRHHMIPLAKNHREANLRLNQSMRLLDRALLPGARQMDITDVPRFRLF